MVLLNYVSETLAENWLIMNSAATFSTFPCLTITSFPIFVMTLKGVFRGPYQIYDDGAFFAQIINSSKQVNAFVKKPPS